MLKHFLQRLDKPEYFFQPAQLALRLWRGRKSSEDRFESVRMPWGCPLRIRVNENVGRSIWHLGIYDLVVSECLWRLTERGDHAVDIGANIGYVSSLFSARTGPEGAVTAFEPHPVVFKRLADNIASWPGTKAVAIQAAVSQSPGTGMLEIPAQFQVNEGLARLAEGGGATSQGISVQVVRLNDQFRNELRPLILKIDTEGGEHLALLGATELLRAKKIRDIVFEDHERYPTPAMVFLLEMGYTVFRLKKGFLGPTLEDVTAVEKNSAASSSPAPWEPPNYLATRDPERARQRFQKRGWTVFKQEKVHVHPENQS